MGAVFLYNTVYVADPVFKFSGVNLYPDRFSCCDSFVVNHIPIRKCSVRAGIAAGPLKSIDSINFHKGIHMLDGSRSIQMVKYMVYIFRLGT